MNSTSSPRPGSSTASSPSLPRRLLRTKTSWAAVTVIVAVFERVLAGELALVDALQLAAPAVLALLLRDAIAKVGLGSPPGDPPARPEGSTASTPYHPPPTDPPV